jgi:hypothetical protein
MTVAAIHTHTHAGKEGIPGRGEVAARRCWGAGLCSIRRCGGRAFARDVFFEAGTTSRYLR